MPLKRAVAAITETLKDYADALIATGVNAIMVDTLFASQSIMSKQMWKEFEGVYVKDLAQHIHDQNCMVMIHNCGNGIYFRCSNRSHEAGGHFIPAPA
jgi:uroporphyrinogen decarboxylase